MSKKSGYVGHEYRCEAKVIRIGHGHGSRFPDIFQLTYFKILFSKFQYCFIYIVINDDGVMLLNVTSEFFASQLYLWSKYLQKAVLFLHTISL